MRVYVFCCFKQKAAYEMRISDWSSDVCSSDRLAVPQIRQLGSGDRRGVPPGSNRAVLSASCGRTTLGQEIAMKLIELDAGNVSLEYRPEDEAVVKRRLGEEGRLRVTKAATPDVISVAGMRIIAMNDWDEPCLISQSIDRKRTRLTLVPNAQIA